MHIPDGYLSPAVCLGTGTLAAGALIVAFRQIRESLGSRTIPLTGMVAALVFAGQMVNFPIGLPVSGHLLGGTLAAVLLGPWGGCVAMTLVLFVQMVLFSDGGWLAFGANVFNMGVIGALGGSAIFQLIRSRIAGSRGVLLGAMFGAWGSVMAAAAAFGIEFVLSHPGGPFNLRLIWVLMASFHSLIGTGEALITGLILSVVLTHRPDLIWEPGQTGAATRLGRVAWTGVTAALVISAFAAPFASELPDGLEAVAERAGFANSGTAANPLVLEDYAVPLPWQTHDSEFWGRVSVSLAGLLGTGVVLGLGWLMTRTLRPGLAAGEDGNAS